ncbi:hypothetical protein ACWC2K_31870 [Streptomyces chattanoogensis]
MHPVRTQVLDSQVESKVRGALSDRSQHEIDAPPPDGRAHVAHHPDDTSPPARHQAQPAPTPSRNSLVAVSPMAPPYLRKPRDRELLESLLPHPHHQAATSGRSTPRGSAGVSFAP